MKWYKENELKIKLITTAISGVFLVISLVLSLTGNSNIIPFDLAIFAIVLSGTPIVLGAVVGVVRDHSITADLLVSLALIGSLILKEWFAAGEVAFIMQVGSILEDLSAAKAKSGLEKLIKLTPKKARVEKEGKETIINADNVNVGDYVIVIAGESVPTDGIIVEGNTSINQANITGESIPLDKKAGDNVLSGTINQFGTFKYRVTAKSENSCLQRMVALAKQADEHPAKIVKKADKWASWLVVISFTTALVTTLVVGAINSDYWLGFERGVTVLVVFCPCAFVLATPTAIMACIGNLTKRGIIVRSGDVIEKLSEVDYATFDKTGTLTNGTPKLLDCYPKEGISKEELLEISFLGESHSEHPLAKAIYNEYKGNSIRKVTDYQAISGFGVFCMIDDEPFYLGRSDLMKEKGVDIDATIKDKASEYRNKGYTVVYVSTDKACLGILALSDTYRKDAGKMVSDLKELNVTPMILTGDNQEACRKIANDVGIERYASGLFPEGKMNKIKEMEKEGKKVCMFGDGVNDTLALKEAYVGIAMGGIGSDIAIESSDAVLVNDDIGNIPYLIRISKKTVKRINVNIIISLSINLVAVVLSILGLLDPVWGAVVHNCGSVLVVFNSLLLLFYKEKKKS